MSTAISRRETFAYSFGDVANNFTYTFINIYLLIFYTDVFGITPIEAATLFLVARIWDAFNDPIAGYIIDKTNTRWGRFRPYILFFSLPLALVGTAVFYVPDLSHSLKLVYAYVTYIGYGMIFTFVIVPYAAVISTISDDTDIRRKLIGTRMALVIIFASSMAAVPALVDALGNGDDKAGYLFTAAMYAAIGFCMHMFFFKNVTERFGTDKKDESTKPTTKQIFTSILQNKPLLILFVVFFTFYCNQIVATSAGMYLFDYVFHAEDMFGIFVLAQIFFTVIGIFICQKLSNKYDPKTLFIFGLFLASLRALPIYTSDLTIFLWFVPITSIGQGIMASLIWSFVPDAVEYGNKKTGHNIIGLSNALIGFSLKFGSAFGGIIPGFMLSWYHYVPNKEQSAESILGMQHMSGAIPSVILLLCGALMLLYPLTRNNMKEMGIEVKTEV